MATKIDDDFDPLSITVNSGIRRSGGYIYEDPIKKQLKKSNEEIYYEMYVNEPVIGGHVHFTRVALKGLNYYLKPRFEDDEEALRQKEFIEECLTDMSHSLDSTIDNMVNCMVYGYKYWEIVYKIRGGDSEEKSRNSKFDDGMIGWRKWMPIKAEAVEKFVFDDDDELCGLWVCAEATDSKRSKAMLPIEKAIQMLAIEENENPKGVSVYRPGRKDYCYKSGLEEQEAIALQRSSGFPIVHMPLQYFKKIQGTDDASTARESARKNAVKDYTKLGTDIRNDRVGGIAFPAEEDCNGKTGWRLRLESTGNIADFDRSIRRHERGMAEASHWMLSKLGSGGEGANRSLGDNLMVLAANGADALNERFKAVLTESVFPRLLRLNNMDPAFGPILESGKVKPESFKEFGDMLESLAASGVEVTHPAAQKVALDKAGLPHPEDIDEMDRDVPEVNISTDENEEEGQAA